jgi:peroxiredoxin
MSGAPNVGELAPKFELPDSAGEKRSLGGLLQAGSVALVFFRGTW